MTGVPKHVVLLGCGFASLLLLVDHAVSVPQSSPCHPVATECALNYDKNLTMCSRKPYERR